MKIADLLRADQKSALLTLKPSLKQNPAYIEEQRILLAKAIAKEEALRELIGESRPDWPEFSEGVDI